MPNFQLHPQLQQDCFPVGHLALSELLMMNDSQRSLDEMNMEFGFRRQFTLGN